MAPLLAGVFAERGKDAAVFRGDDGLDEVTVSTTTHVWWVRGGVVTERSVDPTRVGLQLHPIETLRGGDAAHNAGVVRDVFAGAPGPVRDAVLLNAGIALALTRPDSGPLPADVHADLRAGMDLAAEAIDSGAASGVVDRWVAATRR
jgi:anthranilate phosphoribosyltransferase